MIPQDFIQTLLSRVDIVEVIDTRVPLKKTGANYQACCPFHNEKTPSFTVSPTKQFYHCFGCGAHGTAIGFLMEFSGLGYVEAITALAGMTGMEVPQTAGPARMQVQQVNSLVDIMLRAAHYYRQQLKHAPKAIDYLKFRGLTGEVAARFGLGYAPGGWQNLDQAFASYGDASLEEAGLVIVNDGGQRYDRFRDRIMFPIINQKGDTIGFGGRVLDGGEPKYLNSPETPLFQKGRELYGLFQARRAIRDAGRVLVVEGYMDVVALAQHGVDYAVATLGTATTPLHVQKLLRHTDEIVFCFDGDKAGQKAAWRALEQSLAVVTDSSRVGFLFLPEAHDPDSYIREFGREQFESLLEKATVPLSAYLFKQVALRHDLALDEGKSAFLKDLQPLIAQVAAPSLALMLRKRAAELVQIEMGELVQLWKIAPVRPVHAQAAQIRRPAPASVSHKLLRMVLFQPKLGLELESAWLTQSDDYTQALCETLAILSRHPHLDTAMLLEQSRHLPHAPLIAQCGAEMMEWDEDFDVTPDFDLAKEQLLTTVRQSRMQMLAQKPLRDLTEEDKSELQRLR
ncbi:MAG TPA: DNA primase [Burkholderiales bacterium]|nr:DNA primase [Burkholderiales bacterium]